MLWCSKTRTWQTILSSWFFFSTNFVSFDFREYYRQTLYLIRVRISLYYVAVISHILWTRVCGHSRGFFVFEISNILYVVVRERSMWLPTLPYTYSYNVMSAIKPFTQMKGKLIKSATYSDQYYLRLIWLTQFRIEVETMQLIKLFEVFHWESGLTSAKMVHLSCTICT